MRDFGASRDERRPDVRFCGLGAAVEEWARADWRSTNGMVRRYHRSDHVVWSYGPDGAFRQQR